VRQGWGGDHQEDEKKCDSGGTADQSGDEVQVNPHSDRTKAIVAQLRTK
jgi:hypothetical protein